MNKLIILAGFLLILTACSNQPASVKQYYRLADYHKVNRDIENNQHQSVTINRPKAFSILAGRPMVATKDDGALVQLSYHYWLESPTILIHEALKNWAGQHWQQVVTSAGYNDRHQRLDSQIMAFEKDGNQAKVSMNFKLSGPDGEILLDKTFTQNLSIQGETYSHFVKAINLAISNILDQLSESIDRL
ncbi:MAG: PqiC family protein [Proteobacteria bacterium]|nr:PqiC family protein [Pseudomonadota bacterium]